MVQYQFGERNHGWTFGIEAAYWWMKPGSAAPWEAPAGLDAGLEFSRTKFRIYSEYQTGFIVAGLAAGPYLEMGYFGAEGDDRGIRAGLQYGPWGWFFAGLNLRMRSGPDETYLSPGLFAKIFGCGGCSPTLE